MAGQVALNLQALTFNNHSTVGVDMCRRKKRRNVILLHLSLRFTILWGIFYEYLLC